MHKNLFLALLLTSLIWIVWYTWVVPPPKNINQKEPQKQEVISTSQTSHTTINLSNSKKSSSISYEIKTNKSRYILTDSLSIKELFYKGPVQEVNLILKSEDPFLKVYDELDYTKTSQNENSISIVSKQRDLEITKRLELSKENKLNKLTLEIKNKSKKSITLPQAEITIGPGLNTVKSEEKENPKIWQAIYSHKKEGRKNPHIEKITQDYNSADFVWAGIENRYFIFAVLNENETFRGIKFYEEKIDDHKAPKIALITKDITIKPNENFKMDIKFYAGPKDYELLKSIGYGLHLSIDFGFFAPLAKIANTLLKYFYSLTKNYGFSIILLSILVQIIMLPLTFKSYKAMAIMKKMQPEMKSIQERYKNDPQRMNLELMNLYRKYGANPFSGCWPMLLQIPIFFALFTTLRNSWDLHGAKFILWIKDLSDKDPYFILPIIMGGLMFAQNYISPQNIQDPTQAAIMKWMPIIFTFLFLTFPSGLVLYWIVNSIFSIGLSYYMKKSGFYT